jgi:hypothetical protein
MRDCHWSECALGSSSKAAFPARGARRGPPARPMIPGVSVRLKTDEYGVALT